MSALDRYRHLLDADLVAFIEAHERGFPPGLANAPLDEQRAVYNALCRTFHAPAPSDVTIEDIAIALPDRSISVRVYRPCEAASPGGVLYCHGGGFVFGNLDTHGDMCAELASLTGMETVSVDYRLSPEHRHPAAFDDALAALRWATARWDRAPILFGESAGGALAAAVAHHVRGSPHELPGLVLVYPGLGGHGGEPSFREHAAAPLLSATEAVHYQAIRLLDPSQADDPAVSPLRDTDFSGMPPTFVSVPEYDPLRDEGRRYCAAIRAAGGNAHCLVEAGLVHSFLRARTRSARAAAAFGRIVDAVASMRDNR